LTAVPQHASGYLSFQGETVNPGGAGSGAIALPISSTFALTARGARVGSMTFGSAAARFRRTRFRATRTACWDLAR
jgi:hypothetical protein